MSGHSKWANIKHKKGKADALRGKITTKIANEITLAVRMGGADPTGNMKLKLALTKAKANNVPKDNINRAIQKGLGGSDGANWEEVTYEGYGPCGVALMVNCLTDNRNRTAADIRHSFTHFGGNLGTTGAVAWMFKRKGTFAIDKEKFPDLTEDDLMMMVLDAGAEDIKSDEDSFEITCEPDSFEAVLQALEKNKLECEVAEITMIPDTLTALSAEDGARVQKLLDDLDELDDVQDVFHNADLPDEE